MTDFDAFEPLDTDDKTTRGQANVKQRKDFQPLTHAPSSNGRVPANKDVGNPLFRYREHALQLLAPLMDDKLFALLDEYSLAKIESLKFNTMKSLLSDLKSYAVFVQQLRTQSQSRVNAFPASDQLLADYVYHLQYRHQDGRRRPASRSTIFRHIASIDRWHNLLELSKPSVHFKTRTALETLRNTIDGQQVQKAPLKLKHVKKAMAVCDPAILRDVADVCLLTVAYETLLRRSNLIAIDIEHLKFDDDGGVFITVARTKTDKNGKGLIKYLSPGTTRIVKYWMEKAGIARGALFRGIYSDNTLSERMDSKSVASAFKRIAKRIGHPADFNIGAHSTRIGAVDDLVDRNVDSAAIMLAGNWKDIRMVAHYSRERDAKKSAMSALMHSEATESSIRFIENVQL